MDVLALILSIVLAAYIVMLLPPAFRFAFSKKSTIHNSFSPFISIIVPARNEEKNIPACLQSLAKLDYPADLHEIIVVDDHSTDGTKLIAERFSETKTNVKVISNDAASIGKKSAITTGVAQAKGEIIATTDADCLLPSQWRLRI